MAQTGSGKTLAFGLPLIERTTTARPRRPHSLVLAPTRELANQIADELTPLAAVRGLWLTSIYGGVSMSRQVRALQLGVDIVVATPGRLNDLLEQGQLSLAAVSFVVVDEADQMADMGFLPQVERILKQIEGEPQTLLFSATLDGAVGALVRRYQQNPIRHEVASAAPTVDGLEQRFIGVRSEEKIDVTSEICAGAQRALIFVRTTRAADRVAKRLERTGLRAAAIHGRLSQNRREFHARGVPAGQGARPRRHERRRSRAARGRRRRRRPLRPARGSQDVPAPLRADGSRRRGRHGRHARDVGATARCRRAAARRRNQLLRRRDARRRFPAPRPRLVVRATRQRRPRPGRRHERRHRGSPSQRTTALEAPQRTRTRLGRRPPACRPPTRTRPPALDRTRPACGPVRRYAWPAGLPAD